MKIALEGAMSTGKTTIGKLVAEKLGIPFIEEAARKALEVGFELDKGASAEAQQWILDYQKMKEVTYPEGFIADRGILSVAVYTAISNLIRKNPKKIILTYVEEELKLRKPYDKIIYFPPDVLKLEDDGVRCVDESFQKLLHEQYMNIFENWNIPYYVINSISIEDRVEEICKLIN